MSLVQEALKRKSDEEKAATASTETVKEAGAGVPVPPPPPPAPPAAVPENVPPPPPDAPQKKRPGKGFIIWLLFLLILGSLSYAAYYLFTKGFAEKKETATTESVVPEEPSAAETDISAESESKELQTSDTVETDTKPAGIPTRDVPFSERSTAYKLIKTTKDITQAERSEQEEVASLLEKKPVETVAAAPTAIPTATPIPAPVTVQKAAIKKPQPVPRKTVKKTTAPATKPVTAKAPAKVKKEVKEKPDEPVEWPRIRLNGVMATRNRTDGIAILDGKLTGCGQEVNGVKLISVHKDGVVLEYEGEIRTLRVGGEMF